MLYFESLKRTIMCECHPLKLLDECRVGYESSLIGLLSLSLVFHGKEAINRDDLTGREDVGTSVLGVIGNIIWFLVAGIWLAIGHVTSAIACAMTIIGIPLAVQHLKLAGIALFPIGKTVVPKEVARLAHEENAREELDEWRGN